MCRIGDDASLHLDPLTEAGPVQDGHFTFPSRSRMVDGFDTVSRRTTTVLHLSEINPTLLPCGGHGAAGGIRTLDLLWQRDALTRLSYNRMALTPYRRVYLPADQFFTVDRDYGVSANPLCRMPPTSTGLRPVCVPGTGVDPVTFRFSDGRSAN